MGKLRSLRKHIEKCPEDWMTRFLSKKAKPARHIHGKWVPVYGHGTNAYRNYVRKVLRDLGYVDVE